LPSVQLQNAAAQAQSEVSVDDTYPVREAEPDPFAIAQQFGLTMSDAMRNLPAPIVNVSMPEQPARTRKVERDSEGNIIQIVEE